MKNEFMKKAIELFNEVIKIKPDHVNATHNLAYALIEMGKPREAKKLLNKVISMKPNHTDALYNLANVYKHLGEFHEAENQAITSIVKSTSKRQRKWKSQHHMIKFLE